MFISYSIIKRSGATNIINIKLLELNKIIPDL